MLLLDNETLKNVQDCLKFSGRLGVAPFQLNLKKREVRAVNTRVFKFHFVTNCILNIFAEFVLICIVYIIYNLVATSKLSVALLFVDLVFILALPVAITIDLIQYISRYEIIGCCNSLIKSTDDVHNIMFRIRVEVEVGKEETEDDDVDLKMIEQRQKIFKLFRIIFLFITPTFIFTLFLLYLSEVMLILEEVIKLLNITILMELGFWFNIPFVILFILPLFIYLAICIVSRFYFVSTVGLTIMWVAYHIIQHKLSLKPNRSIDDIDKYWDLTLRNPKNGVKIYQRIHLMLKLIVDIYTFWFAVGFTIVMCICSFLLYFISGYRDSLYERRVLFICFVDAGAILTYGIHMAGRLYEVSKTLLASWNNFNIKNLVGKKDKQERSRYFKTLKPIKIYVGNVYFLSEVASLICWDFIIDKTITLLCCFPFQNRLV